MIKLFAFDCYGTLVDIHTEEGSAQVWNTLTAFMRLNGAQILPERARQLYREGTAADPAKPWREPDIARVFAALYADGGITADEALIAATAKVFRAASTRRLRAYPGAREMLLALRESGRRVVLLSNAQRLFTEPELRTLDLWDCFDTIYISSDHGVKKPSADFFRIMLEREGIAPQDAMMVGNSPRDDIPTALALGMHGCYLRTALTEKGLGDPECEVRLHRPDMSALRKRLLRL